jgi:hypothetical protein
MSEKKIDKSVIDLHKFDTRYQLWKQLVEAGKWVFLAYIFYKVIDSLAGKITLANINFKAVINPEECECYTQYYLAIIFFALLVSWFAIAYGRREAKLRKDTVEKLAIQVQTYQSILDPNRTSSLLTSRGETSERDRR